MTKQNKNLIKQSLIIATALIVCWLFGYIYDFYSFGGLYLFSLVFMFFVLPFMTIIFWRIKNGKQITIPNILFRTGLWLSVGLLVFTFLFWAYYDLTDLIFMFANIIFAIGIIYWFINRKRGAMTLRKYIYLGLCVGFLVISYSLAYFEAIGLFSGIGIIKSIIYQYQFVFSSWYLLDVNIGFVNDITYLFEYIPYYIVIGLLVWSLRINKQMYTNYNKEIIN